MKKLLLLLLLIPILSIGQVSISANNYSVSIKLKDIDITNFKAKVYSLNGQLLREYTNLNSNKTTEDILNDYVNSDGRPIKVTNFRLKEVTESNGVYIVIVEYNNEILKKLIYISN